MLCLLWLALGLIFAGCREPAGQVDADRVVILPPVEKVGNELAGFPFPEWEPDAALVLRAERGLRPFLRAFEPDRKSEWGRHMADAVPRVLATFDEQRRQYCGVVMDGKRDVFINGLPPVNERDRSEWRTRLIRVDDGGPLYWQVMFDPETSDFSNLSCNGSP